MFNLVQCAENTYYLRCFANIGVYHLGNNEVVLIDSGDHRKSVSDVDKAISERNWKVKMVINTHCHVDHINGNRFFKEKYGCKIYSSKIEFNLVEEPSFEAGFYYLGIPVNRQRNFFFKPLGTEALELTDEVLPEGFETVLLPGHSFNMIGVKTPDDVWFLGDAVLDRSTFEDYKLPFFFDVNKSIETAKMLSTLKGKYFVPSHSEATEDISPLANYNAASLENAKEFIFESCNNRTFEEIFRDVCGRYNMTMDIDKFAKISVTIKAFMQALIEDGRLDAKMEGYKLVYFQKQQQ